MVRKTDHVIGSWHQYPDCGDEISYDVPGLNIPASTVSRIGEMFSYYHTSLDTPDQIRPDKFAESVALMADALEYVDCNAIPKARFKGLPSLANPSLDLYLEPANLNNLPNPRMDRTLRDFRTGQPADLRLLMEFFVSNLGGHATLLDIAYEYGVDFQFVRAYAEKFAQKGLIDLVGPVTETAYERRIRQTARGRSGKINL
jgi:aminopeptidase-like protein